MAKKSQGKTEEGSASKKLRSTPPPPSEMDRIFGTLNVRGDTETVLLGGAYLEHELQQVIEAKFPLAKADAELRKRLFDPYSGGVLNSFGAKNPCGTSHGSDRTRDLRRL